MVALALAIQSSALLDQFPQSQIQSSLDSAPVQSPPNAEVHTVVAPLEVRPEKAAYYGLLDTEGGHYGRAIQGGSIAWTFRGSDAFVRRAYNLLVSFGWSGTVRRGKRHFLVKGSPLSEDISGPTLHRGNHPNTWYMVMKPHCVHNALRRYLYGQLYMDPSKARKVTVFGPDMDDPMCGAETVCLNEEALMEEASRLATSFMAYEVEDAYGIVEDHHKGARGQSNDEYSAYLLDCLMRRTQEREEDVDR